MQIAHQENGTAESTLDFAINEFEDGIISKTIKKICYTLERSSNYFIEFNLFELSLSVLPS